MLLLAAAPAPTGQNYLPPSSTIREQIDWKEFLAVTLSHKLGPRVSAALTGSTLADAPEFVQQALRQNRQNNVLRVMRSIAEAKRISRHFRQAGFQIAPIKGTTLAHTLYGDPTARHCGDLDLLVAAHDLAAQVALMTELGYQLHEPLVSFTPARLHIYQRFWKSLSLVHPGTGTMVDLHWRLFNNAQHPANRLNLLPPVGSTAHPYHQFLYSAAHGASDSWVYLKSLADIAAFLRLFTKTDLDLVITQAAGLNLLRQVSSAIHLAGEWMSAPADHPGLLPPGDPFHVVMRARVLERLHQAAFRPRRAAQSAASALTLDLELVPGLRTAFDTAGRYLWRPRVWSVVNLPDRWLWMHPLFGLLLPPRKALSTAPH